MASSYTKNGFVTKLNDKDSAVRQVAGSDEIRAVNWRDIPITLKIAKADTSLSDKWSIANAVRKVRVQAITA